ncbi:MAG: twin-arginine translocase TatA/TatE family subunit [Rubrobacteraceae bacterium]
MFGVGPSELVMVFLLVLLLFGPSKLPQMARDLGKFVGEARRSVDEFKDELTSSVEDEEETRSYRTSKSPPAKTKNTKPEQTKSGSGSAEKEEYDF